MTTGSYKVFQAEVVRPLQRSYKARQSILQSFDTSAAKQSIISGKIYNAIEITSDGLSILRKLHKQVKSCQLLPLILVVTACDDDGDGKW